LSRHGVLQKHPGQYNGGKKPQTQGGHRTFHEETLYLQKSLKATSSPAMVLHPLLVLYALPQSRASCGKRAKSIFLLKESS
jgi:hypothetical protein